MRTSRTSNWQMSSQITCIHIYVCACVRDTWLNHPYVCHDSFLHMSALTHSVLCVPPPWPASPPSISITSRIHLYQWHDTFIYMCDMTHSSICVTWLLHLYERHDSFNYMRDRLILVGNLCHDQLKCVCLFLKMHLERKRITLKLVSPLHRWVLSLLLYLSAYIVYTYIHTYHTCACTLWMKGVIGYFSLATSVCIHHKYILHISTFQYTICVWYIEYVCVYLVNHWGDGLFLLGYIYIHMLLYHNIPRTEEIVLRIITTAKIFNKLARESPYISNTLSRESSKFQTNFHVSQRSPRHSKDLTGIL